MAKQYRLGFMRRLVNRVITNRVRSGKSVGADVRLLTTIGRKTGEQRTNPVTIVAVGGAEWLVAPYGPVAWVHNLRATGTATLSTAGDPIEFRAIDADEFRLTVDFNPAAAAHAGPVDHDCIE